MLWPTSSIHRVPVVCRQFRPKAQGRCDKQEGVTSRMGEMAVEDLLAVIAALYLEAIR